MAEQHGDIGTVDVRDHEVELAVAVEVADRHRSRIGPGAVSDLGAEQRGQQVGVGIHAQRRGLDCADTRFQGPVAAEIGGAGDIGRGRDVGTCGARQSGQEAQPVGALGDGAAIEQQVAAGRQRLTDGAEIGGAGGEPALVEGGGAERQSGLGAMADKVDGVVARMPLGPLGDLGQAVLAGIKDFHPDPGANAVDQSRQVGEVRLDEHHLALAAVLGRVGGAHLLRRIRGWRQHVVGQRRRHRVVPRRWIGVRACVVHRVRSGHRSGTVEQVALFKRKRENTVARPAGRVPPRWAKIGSGLAERPAKLRHKALFHQTHSGHP